MKERTMVFWIGLILFALALVELFGIAWMMLTWMIIVLPYPPSNYFVRTPLVPLIVAGIVFLVIGIVMMRSGRRKGNT